MNVKSILAFAIGPIGAAVISLFSLPIVTWIFQPDDVGRIALFHVVVNFFVMLLTFGTDQAFIRNYHESDNKSRLFNEALLLPIICSVVLVFILVAFFDSAVSELFQSTQQSVIYLCALALILSVLNRYLATVLRMEERGLFYSLSQVLPKVLFLLIVLSYVLFPVALDFSYLLLAHVVAFVVVTVVLVWGNFSFLCHCLSSTVTKQGLKAIMAYGTPLIFGGIAFWGLTAIDKLAIRQWSTLDELAVYSVATSFAAAAMIIQSVFSTVWAPIVYKWAAEGKNLEKVDEVAKYVALLVAIVFSFVAIVSFIIPMFLPTQYQQVQYLTVACMAYPLLYTLSETTVVGIALTRKTYLSMIASIIAFAVNLVGNYLLVPKYGASGAAVSTAWSFFVFFIIRTEFSCYVWRGIPRLKLYFSTLLSVLILTFYVFFGEDLGHSFSLVWCVLLLISVLMYRDQLMASFSFGREKLLAFSNRRSI